MKLQLDRALVFPLLFAWILIYAQRVRAFVAVPPRCTSAAVVLAPGFPLGYFPDEYYSRYDGRWDMPSRYEYDEMYEGYNGDFDDFPPRQPLRKQDANPMSYTGRYYYNQDDNGYESTQPPRDYPNSRYDDYSSVKSTDPQTVKREATRLQSNNYSYRRTPTASLRPRGALYGMDSLDEVWGEDGYAFPGRRMRSSSLTSSMRLPSLFGPYWGSSPWPSSDILEGLHSMMTTMMTLQDQEDDRFVEMLLEHAQQSLSSDATCVAIFGPDLWISHVLSYSQQSSTTFWNTYDEHERGKECQQRLIIQLQVQVEGLEMGVQGIALLSAADGEILDDIFLQLNDGREVNVPVVVDNVRRSRTETMPPSRPPFPPSGRRRRRLTVENDSNVLDAEVVSDDNYDEEKDGFERGANGRHSRRRSSDRLRRPTIGTNQ